MSAIWPSAVATSLELLTAVNNTKVTLNADAGAGDTTMTVDDATPLPASGYLTFDDNEANPETIYYTGIVGTSLTGVTRGADSTSAGSHITGAHLEQRWNAAYHNTMATELIAVEQNLSDRFGVGTNIVVPSSRTFTLAATSNQMILGATRTVTITAPTPASASRTWTIPDISGDGTFASLTGTQVFSGAKTFSAGVTISATTNQLILGTTNTMTITSPAPAASRTLTIPDPGGNASFVMTAGTQILAGAMTFSSDVTISGNKGLIINDGEGTPKTVTIKTPATLTATYTLTLPVDAGTNNYVLTTNGSGVCSWTAAAGSGTVNSGTAGQVAYYATSTTAVSTTAAFTVGAGPNGIIAGTTAGDDAAAGKVGERIVSAVQNVSATGSAAWQNVTSINLTAGDWDIDAILLVTYNSATYTGGSGMAVSLYSGSTTTDYVVGDNVCYFFQPSSTNSYTGFVVPGYRVSVNGAQTVYLKGISTYSGGTPLYFGRISARRRR
jgi:hypothetical protein